MKNILLTPALAAIAGLVFIGAPIVSHAQTPSTTPAATDTAAPAAKKSRFSGAVTAVNASANTITVGTVTYSADATTKFKPGTTLADFKVGELVSGAFTTDSSGKLVLAGIHPKKTKPAAATDTPKA